MCKSEQEGGYANARVNWCGVFCTFPYLEMSSGASSSSQTAANLFLLEPSSVLLDWEAGERPPEMGRMEWGVWRGAGAPGLWASTCFLSSGVRKVRYRLGRVFGFSQRRRAIHHSKRVSFRLQLPSPTSSILPLNSHQQPGKPVSRGASGLP